ncbi:MAG: hypothetical protein K1X75_15030 [Leptospirales bacterium]|nr:hypothetical protein [Leptospirales bacterium]
MKERARLETGIHVDATDNASASAEFEESWGEGDLPHSRFEAFRRFAHRNKAFLFGFMALSMILGVLAARPQRSAAERALESYFEAHSGARPDWRYEVADHYLEEAELSARFPLLAELHLGKQGAAVLLGNRQGYERWAREQYATDTLAYAALREGLLAGAEGRIWMEESLRKAAAEFYLRKRLENDALDLRSEASFAEAAAYIAARPADPSLRGDQQAVTAAVQAMLSAQRRQNLQLQAAQAREAALALLRDRYGPRWNER